jgi:LCP family protein required for cell wall assembly
MGTDTDYGPSLRGGTPRRRRGRGGSAEAERPRRGRRPRRTGRNVLLTILVLVVLLAAIPVALLVTASSRMEKVPVDGLASGGAPLNVLLVGSDSREGMTREEQLELSTGSQGGNLADTIILASMQGNRAALLTFPRDLFVTRCDGTQGRINAAVSIGGPECLVDTVANLSGIPVHHYMEIRFLGFRDVVDALGGVEMCLDDPIRDAAAGIDLPAGCQNLDGGDALGYVRVRAIDDDFGRIARQQEFLQAVARETAQPSTLLNLPRMFRVAAEGGESLRASESVGPFSLGRIAWGLRGLADGAATYTVPGAHARIGGAAVLEPIMSEAEPLFEGFRTGAVLDESADEDALSPEDVTVTVLNGAGVSGLASAVADQLEARGYPIAGIGNADPVDETVVRYPSGQRAAAEMVAAEAPGGARVEEAGVDTVTVVLGADAR